MQGAWRMWSVLAPAVVALNSPSETLSSHSMQPDQASLSGSALSSLSAQGGFHIAYADTQGPARCDLCAVPWLFILSSGRAGSTSLLEATNSLPGVQLMGENGAMVLDGLDSMERMELLREVGNVAANEHTTASNFTLECDDQQRLMDMNPLADGLPPFTMRGFKELVQATSKEVSLDAPLINDSLPHLSALKAGTWLPYMLKTFPCARYIINMRRNVADQTHSGFYRHTPGAEHELINATRTLRDIYEFLGPSRAMMMAMEDFSPTSFTVMAHWLGIYCTFLKIPDANSHNSYTFDYNEVKLNCSAAGERFGVLPGKEAHARARAQERRRSTKADIAAATARFNLSSPMPSSAPFRHA